MQCLSVHGTLGIVIIFSYLREFFLLQIFCHCGIKILCIPFIETVYLPLLFDFNISVHQNKFTKTLQYKINEVLAGSRKFCLISVTVVTLAMAEMLAQLDPFSTNLVYKLTIFQKEQKAENLH